MEMWDIYDKDKKRTGRTMCRNDWNMKPGDFHLTVLGVIQHTDGRYLITKRVMTKSWAPGAWEVSGGAVQAGEESFDAVKREIQEETGLDVSGFEGGYVFSYMRENPEEGDNYFVDIYRFTGDFSQEDIKLQEGETDGYRLATAEEIAALGKEGQFLHYDSIRQVFE
ncbi:MAG: NUDIX domain-containing protein [Wujia sp.]